MEEYTLDELVEKEKLVLVDGSCLCVGKLRDELIDCDDIKRMDERYLKSAHRRVKSVLQFLAASGVKTIVPVYFEVKQVYDLMMHRCLDLLAKDSKSYKAKMLADFLQDFDRLMDGIQKSIIPVNFIKTYRAMRDLIINVSKVLDLKRKKYFEASERDVRADEKLVAMSYTKVLEEKAPVALVSLDSDFKKLLYWSYRILSSYRFGDANSKLRTSLHDHPVRLYAYRDYDNSFELTSSTEDICVKNKHLGFFRKPKYDDLNKVIVKDLERINSELEIKSA